PWASTCGPTRPAAAHEASWPRRPRSKTVTLRPSRARLHATEPPIIPPPIIRTFMLVIQHSGWQECIELPGCEQIGRAECPLGGREDNIVGGRDAPPHQEASAMAKVMKGLDTKLIHAGEPEERIAGAVVMPIFQSST